jgi:hypothetical protein
MGLFYVLSQHLLKCLAAMYKRLTGHLLLRSRICPAAVKRRFTALFDQKNGKMTEYNAAIYSTLTSHLLPVSCIKAAAGID